MSPGIDQAVMKAMAKVPADRYMTAHQFAEEVARAGARDGPARGPYRRWALTSAAVLLLVSVGWWATMQRADVRIERLNNRWLNVKSGVELAHSIEM